MCFHELLHLMRNIVYTSVEVQCSVFGRKQQGIAPNSLLAAIPPSKGMYLHFLRHTSMVFTEKALEEKGYYLGCFFYVEVYVTMDLLLELQGMQVRVTCDASFSHTFDLSAV